MKKRIYLYICFLMPSLYGLAQPTLLYNNGAGIHVKNGATVFINNGSVDNNTGNITNAGRVIVEGNYVNNATTTGAATSTGVYEVKANWVNNATFTADQSKVKLNAPANQQITGTQVTNFYNLTLDSGFIKTQTLDALTTQNLELNDAELATDVYKMTVTNTMLNAISRTSGFVSSLGTGQLVRHTNTTGNYFFPTGSSVGTTRYRPIYFTPKDNNLNEFGARLANVDATTETYNRNVKESDICDINPNFYHRLYHNAGNSLADIRFIYDPLTDNAWETMTQWRNAPQWEKITANPDVPWLGQISKQLVNWGNYNSSAFAFSNLLPVIDTANLDIVHEYCGPHGSISGIQINNMMAGTTYTWSLGGLTVATGQATNGNPLTLPLLPNLLTGNYTLSIVKPNGCAATMSYFVGFDPTYTTNIVPTNVGCFGQATGAADLQITNGFSPFTYYWSNAATTQDINNVLAGNYIVTIKDAKGCIQKDTVMITQPPKLLVSSNYTPETCERSDGTTVANVTGGTPNYTYTWNTVPPQYTNAITDLVQNTYTVLVTDANGCTFSHSVVIPNIPTPTAEFTADNPINTDIILTNATIHFTNESFHASTYSWNFGDDFTSAGENPSHTYQTPGEYTVSLTAFNSLGCSNVYYLGQYIIVPDGAIYFPNVFTPNGDGKNDEFYVAGEGISAFNMTIFDRWGKQIKTLNNINETWDGKVKGIDAPEGTYTFVVDYVLNYGGRKKRGGTINLIR